MSHRSHSRGRGSNRGGRNINNKHKWVREGDGRNYSQHDDRDQVFPANHFDRPINVGRGFKQSSRRGSRGGRFMNIPRQTRIGLDDDGDLPMGDGGRGSQRRHYNKVIRDAGGMPSEGGKSWFRAMLPFTSTMTKNFLIQLLQSNTQTPFKAEHWEIIGKATSFWVKSKAEADALRSLSRTLTLPSGQQLTITVSMRPPPVELLLTGDALEKLKLTMSSRYNTETRALDLSNFSFDKGLAAQNLTFHLCRDAVLKKVVDIITEFIPEVTSLDLSNNNLNQLHSLTPLITVVTNFQSINVSKNRLQDMADLNCLVGLPITELDLSNNPIVRNYNSAKILEKVLKTKFPLLKTVNGQAVKQEIGFDAAADPSRPRSFVIPTMQPLYSPSPDLQTMVTKLLWDYYQIFDTDATGREALNTYYHPNTVFSMVSARTCRSRGFNTSDTSKYVKESRNLFRINEGQRDEKFKRGKLQTIAFLASMPLTQHVYDSFTLDITVSTPNMLVFTTTGLFREREEVKKTDGCRRFSRTCIVVLHGESLRPVIVNEMLTIAAADPKLFEIATAPSAPTASSVSTSSTATLEQKRTMVIEFSAKSGMNLTYSERCLVEHDWDFVKAGTAFTELHQKGAIPAEAFAKQP